MAASSQPLGVALQQFFQGGEAKLADGQVCFRNPGEGLTFSTAMSNWKHGFWDRDWINQNQRLWFSCQILSKSQLFSLRSRLAHVWTNWGTDVGAEAPDGVSANDEPTGRRSDQHPRPQCRSQRTTFVHFISLFMAFKNIVKLPVMLFSEYTFLSVREEYFELVGDIFKSIEILYCVRKL